jgi:hypothetical protein
MTPIDYFLLMIPACWQAGIIGNGRILKFAARFVNDLLFTLVGGIII